MEKSRQEIRAKGLLGTNPAIYILRGLMELTRQEQGQSQRLVP